MLKHFDASTRSEMAFGQVLHDDLFVAGNQISPGMKHLSRWPMAHGISWIHLKSPKKNAQTFAIIYAYVMLFNKN